MIVGVSTPMECFTFLQVLPYLDSLVTSLIPLVCVGACRVSVYNGSRAPLLISKRRSQLCPSLVGGRDGTATAQPGVCVSADSHVAPVSGQRRYEQRTLSVRVMSRWKSAMMAPSNSAPRPVLMVVGEKAFQMMFSQMFVAMNSEIPEPSPYLMDTSISTYMYIPRPHAAPHVSIMRAFQLPSLSVRQATREATVGSAGGPWGAGRIRD